MVLAVVVVIVSDARASFAVEPARDIVRGVAAGTDLDVAGDLLFRPHHSHPLSQVVLDRIQSPCSPLPRQSLVLHSFLSFLCVLLCVLSPLSSPLFCFPLFLFVFFSCGGDCVVLRCRIVGERRRERRGEREDWTTDDDDALFPGVVFEGLEEEEEDKRGVTGRGIALSWWNRD